MALFQHCVQLVLAMLVVTLQVCADESNVSHELEAAYDSSISKITGLPDGKRAESLEQLRSSVSTIVTALVAYEDKNAELGGTHSNVVLEDVVSAGFQGELFRLIRQARQGDKGTLRLIDQRVGSFVRLYPIAPKSSAEERISLTLFLAKAATVVPDSVRASSRARLAELAVSDRLPLLIALAGLGDQESQKSLQALDSPEAKKLQHVFQTFSKNP